MIIGRRGSEHWRRSGAGEAATYRKTRLKNKKKKLAIVGLGSLGRVLALALHAAGYAITEIVSRDSAKSRRQAAGLALAVGARPATVQSAQWDADVIWLCVPDDAIAITARELAANHKNWKNKIVLHSSGALAAGELAALKRRGAAVGSAHPMNTFVGNSKPSFAGTPFSVEGDGAAVRMAAEIAGHLNAGDVFRVSSKQKPLYHVVGSFSSPLLISLLSAAETVARKAGVRRPQALTRRILQQTIENYLHKGADAAFSGPIRRGDIATIKKHLLALKEVPAIREIYVALAKNAVRSLPVKRGKEIKELLNL